MSHMRYTQQKTKRNYITHLTTWKQIINLKRLHYYWEDFSILYLTNSTTRILKQKKIRSNVLQNIQILE